MPELTRLLKRSTTGLNRYGIDNMVCVPNVNNRRVQFWRELLAVNARWSGPWCIGGDFNIIKYPEEKLGGCSMSSQMTAFFDWINNESLLDL